MRAFQFEGRATRTRFGSGSLACLSEEVERLGLSRVLLITTPQQIGLATQARAIIGANVVAQFTDATMHTPVEVTARAMDLVRAERVDGLVALGGGSTIGLSKALSVRTGLPQVVVPTTYAGSEMTPILGETEGGRKSTRRDPKIQPQTVVYDVDLTLSLPPAASVTSGLNAIAHGVEALYAHDANPVTSLLAEEGIRLFASALPAILARPNDVGARSQALQAAWLCGTCLGQVAMGLHHKLCHTLGGSYDLPHAETHSVILPHVIAYNRVASQAMKRVAQALGTNDDPALAMHRLASRLGAPTSLRQLGMEEGQIAEAAEIATANPYPNPRPIDRNAVEALLRRAWAGDTPEM